MVDDTIRVLRGEDEPVTAYVQDTAVAGVRSVMVRLVARGTVQPRHTISTAYADVDLDAEGNLIGLNLVWYDSPDAGEVEHRPTQQADG